MRVLLVEDDVPLRTALARWLEQQGHRVDQAGSAREGEYYAQEFAVDVAVIDLGLPDRPGIDLIAALRAGGSELPVLILTARSRWQEKVAGLRAGADDYLVKPFHQEELLARIEALSRRAAGQAHPVLTAGPVSLDPHRQEVAVDGRTVDLTTYEYRLLETLMRHPGEVLSKATLTDALYDQDFPRDSNTIEVFVGRLRRKLDPDGRLQPIETLRGRGYRLVLAAGGPALPA